MKLIQDADKTPLKPTILIAENGAETLNRLNACTSPDRYDMRAVGDGATALLMISRLSPHLIILDVGLAKVSWTEFYQLVRTDLALARTPVLILTNSADDVYHLADFELGNTDFVVKPCTTQELVLRMRRLLYTRQISDPGGEILTFDGLQLDVDRHEVVVDGNPVYLTAKEFKLLTTLAQRHGRVQPRERLLQDVFDYNTSFLQTRTIDTHMRRLRNKLGSARRHLETVRGVGYRFCERPVPGQRKARRLFRRFGKAAANFTTVKRGQPHFDPH